MSRLDEEKKKELLDKATIQLACVTWLTYSCITWSNRVVE